MSRNPLIEAIHAARYDLDGCAATEQATFRKKLEELVAKAVSQSTTPVTGGQVLDLLHEDYREYRRMRRRQEWPKLQ